MATATLKKPRAKAPANEERRCYPIRQARVLVDYDNLKGFIGTVNAPIEVDAPLQLIIEDDQRGRPEVRHVCFAAKEVEVLPLFFDWVDSLDGGLDQRCRGLVAACFGEDVPWGMTKHWECVVERRMRNLRHSRHCDRRRENEGFVVRWGGQILGRALHLAGGDGWKGGGGMSLSLQKDQAVEQVIVMIKRPGAAEAEVYDLTDVVGEISRERDLYRGQIGITVEADREYDVSREDRHRWDLKLSWSGDLGKHVYKTSHLEDLILCGLEDSAEVKKAEERIKRARERVRKMEYIRDDLRLLEAQKHRHLVAPMGKIKALPQGDLPEQKGDSEA